MKMKTVEAKVFAALCILLIINFGSADNGEGGHVEASTSAGSPGSSASLVAAVGHVVTSHHLNDSDTVPDLGNTDGLSNETLEEEKKKGSVTAAPEGDSGPTTVNPSVTAALESNLTQPSPSSPPAVSNTPTTGVPLVSSSIAGPTQPDPNDRTNITVTAAPSANASVDSANQTKANSSAEVTSSEPPKMESTTTTTPTPTTTASTTVSSTTSSTTTTTTTTTSNSISSTTTTSTQVSSTKSASPPSSQSTSQTEGPHQGRTTAQPSSTTTQGKGHVASPSQLNVNGEDTKMMPDSRTLDPLLASLVSAFIITAVIVILLLFLKLRKRGNQPEFRRLQDLPMDDMMEDTPLSMYSY